MNSDLTGYFAGGTLISLVICLLLFLMLREFFCWYWKINTIVALLREIRDGLPSPASSSASREVASVPVTSQLVHSD